jgi:AraC family transcriptional regulator of adaptative response/methylated-DNA-[protein]-cysteine methyltransferase
MTTAIRNARLAALVTGDPRWAALVARDSSTDGTFVYSVRTTGVYCRPSCPSRRPRPENVRFHATPAAAAAARFRPCKRCRPTEASLAQRQVAKVTTACRLIESSPRAPGLEALAAKVGMSMFHFHRVFKAVTGLTPREYAVAHRAGRVRRMLGPSRSVTRTIYESGYNSNARFYADAGKALGMTPGAYRAGGASVEIRFAIGECSLGSILVASTTRGVCAILMGDDPERLARDFQEGFPHAVLIGGDPGFERLVARVVGLVEAPRLGLDLPLDVLGTVFQHRVWRALRGIPAGKTATYSDIAKRIGSPKSARAVASACATNSLAVAIPCHRVVRRDGAVSGYRWGVERKRALLEREASA